MDDEKRMEKISEMLRKICKKYPIKMIIVPEFKVKTSYMDSYANWSDSLFYTEKVRGSSPLESTYRS